MLEIKQCPTCKQYFPATPADVLCPVCRNKEPEIDMDALKDLFGMFEKEPKG